MPLLILKIFFRDDEFQNEYDRNETDENVELEDFYWENWLKSINNMYINIK